VPEKIHCLGRRRSLSYVSYQQEDRCLARCLNINVASDGDTERQAVDNLREALALYFEDADNDLPDVEHPLVGHLTLKTS
jgi:hypothetical protein